MIARSIYRLKPFACSSLICGGIASSSLATTRDQHRTVGAEGGLQRFIHLGGFFNAYTFDTAGLGDAGEVGIVELRTVGEIAPGLHLHRHEAQHAVVKDDNFTGSFICASDRKSPISMLNPPSPHMATTCRSGAVAWAPMACGMALAIEP